MSELRKLAKQHRWKIEPTRGSHFRVTTELGSVAISAATPRNPWRSIKNLTAELRRQDRAARAPEGD